MNKQWNDEELENVNTMGMAGDEIDVNADFEEADKLSKLSKDAYDFIKQGNFEEAKDLFYRILEQESENHYALVGLGDISRKKGESLLIGDDIEITVEKIDSSSVKISIKAPKEKIILRKEVYERVKEENSNAIVAHKDILDILK